MNWPKYFWQVLLLVLVCSSCSSRSALVLQSDFGTRDGAVNAMKAVAYSLDSRIAIFDLTHEIPPYSIWDAAYRLHQSASYWPQGTVFVSVVDPGVGTTRKSIVAKTRSGHFFVSPDNGTLTLLAGSGELEELREIKESQNRRPGSEASYTFHGRDIYAYVGAQLASGKIGFEAVGERMDVDSLVLLNYLPPQNQLETISGTIMAIDPEYGNIWTNIPKSLIDSHTVLRKDAVQLRIFFENRLVHSNKVPLVNTFGELPPGTSLAYYNSLLNFSLALNQASYADSFRLGYGPGWKIVIDKPKK